MRITLAVTSFPLGWRKQYLQWFAERNTYFYQALKLSRLMSGFQGYSRFYSHIHMFQGLFQAAQSYPCGMHTVESRLDIKGGRMSAWPDFKGPGKMPPPSPPHPLFIYTSRVCPTRRGENGHLCVPITSQKVFLGFFHRWGNWGWKIINALRSWPGNRLCFESIKVCSLERSW